MHILLCQRTAFGLSLLCRILCPLNVLSMAEKQDIAMNAFQIVTDVAYIYGEKSDSSQGKIKKDTFLNGIMKEMSLPRSGTNTIGDYDELDSGYGFYNNTSDASGQYAPAGTAGIFIRFRLSVETASTTLFLPISSGEHKLWYRKKGGVCAVFGQ